VPLEPQAGGAGGAELEGSQRKEKEGVRAPEAMWRHQWQEEELV
jgi:hypothetical protein